MGVKKSVPGEVEVSDVSTQLSGNKKPKERKRRHWSSSFEGRKFPQYTIPDRVNLVYT